MTLRSYRKPVDQARDAARGFNDPDRGLNDGLIDKEYAKPRKGIGLSRQKNYTRRIYEPGKVAMLGAPAGVAINAGLGLLNPFGANRDMKQYLLTLTILPNLRTQFLRLVQSISSVVPVTCRTGMTLARPDVSKAEYNKYKAYKYDKGIDLNITDGDFNVMGVLKGTTEVSTVLRFSSSDAPCRC